MHLRKPHAKTSPERKEKASVQSLPHPEEWDFTDCPPEQSELCYQYEYLRECLDVAVIVFKNTRAAKRIEARLGIKAFEQAKRRWASKAPLQQIVDRLSLFRVFEDEFPDTPFLRIRAERRALQGVTLELDLSLAPASSVASCHDLMAAKASDLLVDKRLREEVIFIESGFCMGVYPIRINWSLGKQQLLDQFWNWTKGKLPDGLRMRDARDTTAKERLKNLAALRLAVLGVKFEVYRDHSKIARREFGGKLMPLYSSEPTWHRAKSAAITHMKEVFYANRPTQRQLRRKQKK